MPIFIDTQFFDIIDKNITDEGYLDISASIAKSGIQEYNTSEPFLQSQLATFPPEFQKENKIVRVLRPKDEVFKDNSMASFKKRPVTNNHPPKLVNAIDTKKYAVGFSGPNVTRVNDLLKTDLLIWDEETIKEIQDGKRQISAGYKADLVFESGNDPEYGPYDAKFTNILGNHIAIVMYGRAGSTVKIGDKKPKKEAPKMAKRVIGNVELEISDDKVGVIDAILSEKSQLEKTINDHLATIDAKDKEIANTKSELDKVKGEKDALEAKVNDADTIDKMVEERTAICDSAKKLIKDFDPKGKTNKQIKIEALKTKIEDTDFSKKSDDYIDAAFDMLNRDLPKSKKKNVQDAINGLNTNDDTGESEYEKRRKQHIVDTRTSYLGEKKENK